VVLRASPLFCNFHCFAHDYLQLLNSYNWHSGCLNYQMTAFVFFIFKSAGEGEGWFEGDSTWLIHLKKNHQKHRQPPKNNQNQTNTTGAQNLKEFNNTAGWLSVFLVVFF
jgi:hypothetical protein